MEQLVLFKPEPRPVVKAVTYCDLDIHRRINARANSFIHRVYYRGNNYAVYPMRSQDVRDADGLTRLYFKQYELNAGKEVLWRRALATCKLF